MRSYKALSTQVRASDPDGASVIEGFTISVLDAPDGGLNLELNEFNSSGMAGEIGKLKVVGRPGLT